MTMILLRHLWRSAKYVTQSSNLLMVSNMRCSSGLKALHTSGPLPVPSWRGRLLSFYPCFLKILHLSCNKPSSRVFATRGIEKDCEKYGYVSNSQKDCLLDHNDNVQEKVQQHDKWHRVSQRSRKRSAHVSEAVLQELVNIGMTREEALDTVSSPQFRLVADAAVIQTIYCLMDFEMPPHQIRRSSWILLQSADKVEAKLNMVTSRYLFHNHYDGMGFCLFDIAKIQKLQKFFGTEAKDFPEHNNRLYYMSDRLMIPVDELTEKMVKVPQLFFFDFKRIECFMNLFDKYNIHSEDILNYLWIFLENVPLADKRLQEIVSAGCKRPKPWMLCCQQETYNRTIKKYQLQKQALGNCASKEEYLMKRLECTKEDLTVLVEFNKLLKRVSATKMERVIDLLLSEGFTTNQIRSSLRIVLYSEDRTAERIRELKALGLKTFHISVLFKNPRSFKIYCNKFNVNEMNKFSA